MSKIHDFILLIALLTPCMPKIAFAKDVSLYPLEILLIVVFPFLITKQFYLKKQLLMFWTCILFSTLFSFLYGPTDLGGAMRCIKGLIYIPLIYIAYKSKRFSYATIAYVLIPASIINIVFHVSQGFSFSNISIWDNNLLMSGLSRWSYVPSSNSFIIQQSAGGTHGIWGNYNVLALCTGWIAYISGKINKITFLFIFSAAVVSLLMVVSREALIVFVCVSLGYFLANSIRNGTLHISFKAYLFISIFIIGMVGILTKYGEYISVFQKMQYTIDSLNDSGKEQSANLRMGAWYMFFLSLIQHPWAIFIGYGYNLGNYANNLRDIIEVHGNIDFVTLPESFFIEAWCFGGVFCLIYAILYWKKLYLLLNTEPIQVRRFLLKGLFIGLLIANTVSGASIISDLLYGQFLIFLGFFLHEKKSEGII